MPTCFTALASEPMGRLLPAPAVPLGGSSVLCSWKGQCRGPPMHPLTTWTVHWGRGKTWGGWPCAAGRSGGEWPSPCRRGRGPYRGDKVWVNVSQGSASIQGKVVVSGGYGKGENLARDPGVPSTGPARESLWGRARGGPKPGSARKAGQEVEGQDPPGGLGRGLPLLRAHWGLAGEAPSPVYRRGAGARQHLGDSFTRGVLAVRPWVLPSALVTGLRRSKQAVSTRGPTG